MFSISVIMTVLLLLEFSYICNNFIMLHDYVSPMFAIGLLRPGLQMNVPIKPFRSTSVVLKCAIEIC